MDRNACCQNVLSGWFTLRNKRFSHPFPTCYCEVASLQCVFAGVIHLDFPTRIPGGFGGFVQGSRGEGGFRRGGGSFKVEGEGGFKDPPVPPPPFFEAPLPPHPFEAPKPPSLPHLHQSFLGVPIAWRCPDGSGHHAGERFAWRW